MQISEKSFKHMGLGNKLPFKFIGLLNCFYDEDKDSWCLEEKNPDQTF